MALEPVARIFFTQMCTAIILASRRQRRFDSPGKVVIFEYYKNGVLSALVSSVRIYLYIPRSMYTVV